MKKILEKKVENIYDYVYYDNEIVKYEEATIGVAANTLQYGTGVFSGIRGYSYDDGSVYVYRLKDHWKRLMESAHLMHMKYFIIYEDFKKIIDNLIKKNNCSGRFYIRAFIFCDKAFLGPKLQSIDFDLCVYMQKLGDYIDSGDGLKLQISSFIKYSDNAISTKGKVNGGYVNSMLAAHQAHCSGYDDALMLNENGKIVEASVANILLVKDNIVYVPPMSDGALNGITQRSCVEILSRHGYDIRYESITRSTVYTADELIVTGTAMTINKTISVDERKIGLFGNDKVFNLLNDEFDKIINRDHELSSQWLEEVK